MVTLGYISLHKVTVLYVTVGIIRLQCFIYGYSGYHMVTAGYIWLKWVTYGYSGLQSVTHSCMWLQ